QKLAQLLTNTIALELEAAKAELKNRRHRLAEMEAGTRPQELEQARARMAGAEARRDFLTMRRDRFQTSSRRQGAITEDELDEAISAAIEAEQAYQEATAAHALAVAGPRVEQIAQARALVEVQQAIVDQIADKIAKHSIVSRFDGYVIEEFTEVGQWVSSGDPVAEVAALDEVEVVTQVVEQSVPFIEPGSTVSVDIPSLADRGPFPGVVIAAVPQADVRARTFPVKIRVQNEIGDAGPLLKSGMYARVALPVGRRQKAVLVPKDAVVLGGPSPVVFTVSGSPQEGAVAEVGVVPVQIGVAQDRYIQVLGDVKPGVLVIVQGNERLRPGQQVSLTKIVRATASPPTDSGGASAAPQGERLNAAN
ncbi:MAG: efflux RND transporter periplasmic adaptor subunit, partial [Planctomycetota bacterium]